MTHVPSIPCTTLMLAVACLGGCADLTVQVDVLNPAYVLTATDATEHVRTFIQIASSQPGELQQSLDTAIAPLKSVVGKLAQLYQNEVARSLSDPALQAHVKDSGQRLAEQIGEDGAIGSLPRTYGPKLELLATQIREQTKSTPWTGSGPAPELLRALLTDFIATRKQYADQVAGLSKDVADDYTSKRQLLVDLKAQVSPQASNEALGVAAKTVEGLDETKAALAKATKTAEGAGTGTSNPLLEGDISNSQYAFAVASAPETFWAQGYNQALGKGRFGDLDVVITMNNRSDFSVKGMRFDATTVAAVASKVLTQSVLLATQVSGANVLLPGLNGASSANNSGGGDALSKSSLNLANSEAVVAGRQARLAGQKRAMRSLAWTLLSACMPNAKADKNPQPCADLDPTSVKAAKDAIQTLKPSLTLEDVN